MSDLSPPLKIGVALAHFQNFGNILVSIEVLNMMAKKVSLKGKASFKKKLEMVSFPKLLAVLGLAIASLMSKALMCFNLNQVLFLLTMLSPAR